MSDGDEIIEWRAVKDSAKRRPRGMIDNTQPEQSEYRGRTNGQASQTGANHRDDEIPWALHEEIASWRRITNRASPNDGRDLLWRATTDLFRTLSIIATDAPERYVVGHQAIVDALQEFTDTLSIEHDDALFIMAEARKAAASGFAARANGRTEKPQQGPCSNGPDAKRQNGRNIEARMAIVGSVQTGRS